MAEIELKRKPDGKRYVRIYGGTDKSTGKPMRHMHTFPDDWTDENCYAWIKAFCRRRETCRSRGADIRLDTLLNEYIDIQASLTISENAARTYYYFVRLLGRLGTKPACDITSDDLTRHYTWLQKHGGKKGEGIGRRTILELHNFLKSAWSYIIDLGVCDTNPVCKAKKPKPEKVDSFALADDEIKILKTALYAEMESGTPYMKQVCAAALIALHAGLRVGEVCALTWRNADMKTLELVVEATVIETGGGVVRKEITKGKKTRRVAMGPTLRQIIVDQKSRVDVSKLDAPIVGIDGKLMRPQSVSRSFKDLAIKAGLPEEIRFHTLRHTHATQLLINGLDDRTVSERMGHAQITTTLETYSHVMPGRDRVAAEVISDVIGGKPSEVG